jgi:hypothetical protein
MAFMYSLFYLPTIVAVALQVFFAIHCIRGGKPAWLFVILFFPFVGSLVYFFVEFLPEMRARGTVSSAARRVRDRINPAAEIQRLEDQVAISNSLVNRLALARGSLGCTKTTPPCSRSSPPPTSRSAAARRRARPSSGCARRPRRCQPSSSC